jgi:hypothetical protein
VNTVKTKTRLLRLTEADNEQVVGIAIHLGISPSEVFRRALRIAAPVLVKTKAPGVEVCDDR